MKISGFTMVRNATRLYFPVAESIASALPLVDELVVALGQGDPDDHTEDLITAIGSPKIKIIRTVWDTQAWPQGTIYAQQTDLARAACSGDWLLYLQADEVLHEQDYPAIRQRCHELLDRPEVEGLLFAYHHFWGDFQHVHQSHCWYRNEIRIIRNHPDIHSWGDAQSFRRIPGFAGTNYRQQDNTYKLRVAKVKAHIYHYGWVRPPELMQKKQHIAEGIHHGSAVQARLEKTCPPHFAYSPLGRVPVFRGTHPAVMADWIARFHWADQLNYTRHYRPGELRQRHDALKYRLLSWVENRLLGGQTLWGFKNYHLLDE
jgi:hypothetical protein